MFFNKLKNELCLMKAFKRVFCDKKGNITHDGAKVIAFLRDEACGRGELGRDGVPYFYDGQNRFDANAGAFLLGKRRMFDLMVKYLSLDERQVFALMTKETEEERLEDLRRAIEV